MPVRWEDGQTGQNSREINSWCVTNASRNKSWTATALSATQSSAKETREHLGKTEDVDGNERWTMDFHVGECFTCREEAVWSKQRFLCPKAVRKRIACVDKCARDRIVLFSGRSRNLVPSKRESLREEQITSLGQRPHHPERWRERPRTLCGWKCRSKQQR